jgi:hypothetical protein
MVGALAAAQSSAPLDSETEVRVSQFGDRLYHAEDCPQLSNMRTAMPVREAEAKGYSPHSACLSRLEAVSSRIVAKRTEKAERDRRDAEKAEQERLRRAALRLAAKKLGPGRWTVKRTVSKMDDSQTVTLSLRAAGTISGWPGKVVTPTLILRCKEGNVEAYIVTGMAANVEHGSEGASLLVRFDKEPPLQWTAGRSTDNEALFLEYPKEAIWKMMGHHSMLFRFTPFNSSPQETSFTLTGLAAAVEPLLAACGWDPGD